MTPRSQPPRRRVRKAAASTSSLPLIALVLGVVVAGLGIGAALSLLGRTHAPPSGTVAYVAATPTDAPVPVATNAVETTPAPARTPTPHPKRNVARATPAASLAPLATPSPARPAETASAAAPAPAPASPAATPVASETARATSAPATAAAATAATLETAQTSAPAPVADSGEASLSAFSRASRDVVRRYLQALMDGDEATARATLVDARSDLSEEPILDRDSRLRDVVAHGTEDTAEVTLVIETPRANYAGRYFLVKSDAGNPQIRAHDLSKL